MATYAHNPAHVSKRKKKTQATNQKATNQKATRDSYKGTKPFENELRAVPSIFYHPLPNVNSAQGLSYQLKSKG